MRKRRIEVRERVRGPVGDKAIKSNGGERERGPSQPENVRRKEPVKEKERIRLCDERRRTLAEGVGLLTGCERNQERGKGCCVCWHGPVRQRLLPHTNRRNYS